MAEQPGNAIPAPGVYRGATVNDDELLYSTVGYTQKGVTLKAGQGLLLLGTVLARDTASKKYVKFDAAGTNGANEAVGILRQTVETGTDANGLEFQNNIVILGILKLEKIVAANGGSDAALAAFDGARVNETFGTFTL